MHQRPNPSDAEKRWPLRVLASDDFHIQPAATRAIARGSWVSFDLMLLVIDRDNTVGIYDSVADAEGHLETIDIEGGEYEFCDETGQPYCGDVLEPVGKFRSGQFRIVPRGARDPSLPTSFLSRASDYHSKLPGLKTLEDACAHFAAQKI